MAATDAAAAVRPGLGSELAGGAGDGKIAAIGVGPSPAPRRVSSPEVRFEHVLLPLDGSKLSLAAMRTAHALAERFGAALHTISVTKREGDVGRLLAAGTEALGPHAADDRAVVVIDDDPAAAIARRAEELGSCLVCLSTHGRGRLTGAVLGSVTRSVLKRSGPVVALGPLADRPGWSPPPRSWPEPLSTSRIVACVDGSEASELVLPAASGWARALGMSLTILTVVEDVPEPLEPVPRTGRYGSISDAESYVEELARRWHGTACDVDGQVVRSPIGPASGISRHLDQQPAGLVAVSTHARSGFDRVLRGATAANIVRASVAPCLVVPT
jgi:nucleotide-binding universal stress UspA family protein